MKRLVLGIASVLLVVAPAWAVTSHGNGPFRIEWDVAAPGRISGRIHNEYQRPATAIRVLVEALDRSNRVVARKYEWVGGDIAALSDRFFEVRDVPPADHYRVSVHSYEILLFPGRRRW